WGRGQGPAGFVFPGGGGMGSRGPTEPRGPLSPFLRPAFARAAHGATSFAADRSVHERERTHSRFSGLQKSCVITAFHLRAHAAGAGCLERPSTRAVGAGEGTAGSPLMAPGVRYHFVRDRSFCASKETNPFPMSQTGKSLRHSWFSF